MTLWCHKLNQIVLVLLLWFNEDIDCRGRQGYALTYRTALERRNHQVSTTDNGEDCLRIYREEFNKVTSTTDPTEHIQPFDAVVLYYEMPKINDMEVAKQILTVNSTPANNISSYVKEDVSIEYLNQLSQVVELLQKPFGEDSLMDTIEDKEIIRITKLHENTRYQSLRILGMNN